MAPVRLNRLWAILALLLIVCELGALVVVWNVSPQAAAAPTGEPTLPSTSAYAKLFAQVQPDGTVSKETALEAFDLAIAPLPGVTPPTGTPPSLYERADGTFAIDWIRPYLDQLTPDQKKAVDAAMAPDPNSPLVTPAPSSAGLQVRAAVDTSATYFENAVAAAQPKIAAKLGRSLGLGWSVTLNQTQVDGSLAYTTTVIYPVYGSTACAIHVNPSLANSGDEAAIRATMAHELFHCFQDDYLDKHGNPKLPDWIIEGQAEWAGEDIGGPSSVGKNWWGTYLTEMDTSLWQRTYDAYGFYQHLSEEGIDPWGHFDAMLAATTNVDAFKAAGATADTFLDTWASGLYRDLSLGDPWYAQGPWQLKARAQPHELSLNSGDSKDLETHAVLNQDWTISSYADIVEIRMQGHVRLHTDPSSDETNTAQRWLCTKADGCTCPPGERYSGPDLEKVAPVFELGLTGSLDGAGGNVKGHALSEFCKPSPTQSPGNPCRTNCGDSNGDPHLRTVNSFRYDFQGAGEFVLLRSPDDSIEIQSREEPYIGSSGFRGVATNTAVAAKVNSHRVAVYGQASGLDLRVDGTSADPSSAIDLGPGASIHRLSTGNYGGIELDYPDGTVVWVLSVGQWGINILVQPSDALRANGRGLLGPITRGGLGVPALPDGTQLPPATSTEQRFSIVYGRWADAWRVTDASTLFDYDPGKSTATYTDKGFPADAKSAAPPSFPPGAATAAATACASITDPELQPECVFDVEVTGDDGFAQAYAAQQDFYDSGIVPASPVPETPAPAASGGINGAVKPVTPLQDLGGATAGPDGTIYVSIDDASGQGLDPVLRPADRSHPPSHRRLAPERPPFRRGFGLGLRADQRRQRPELHGHAPRPRDARHAGHHPPPLHAQPFRAADRVHGGFRLVRRRLQGRPEHEQRRRQPDAPRPEHQYAGPHGAPGVHGRLLPGRPARDVLLLRWQPGVAAQGGRDGVPGMGKLCGHLHGRRRVLDRRRLFRDLRGRSVGTVRHAPDEGRKAGGRRHGRRLHPGFQFPGRPLAGSQRRLAGRPDRLGADDRHGGRPDGAGLPARRVPLVRHVVRIRPPVDGGPHPLRPVRLPTLSPGSATRRRRRRVARHPCDASRPGPCSPAGRPWTPR